MNKSWQQKFELIVLPVPKLGWYFPLSRKGILQMIGGESHEL